MKKLGFAIKYIGDHGAGSERLPGHQKRGRQCGD